MEMKPENVPDELLIQAGMVHVQLPHLYRCSRHCLRNLRYLHDWLRHLNNASRRTQSISTIGHGRTFL